MEHEMCFYLDWELNVDDPVNSLPLYEAVWVLFFINTSSLLTTSKQQKKCWAAIIVQGLFMLKEINWWNMKHALILTGNLMLGQDDGLVNLLPLNEAA